MQFNETQQELLVNAYLLSREGKGQVIADHAYPDAHRAGRGRLARALHFEPDGEMSWWWTTTAETALDTRHAPAQRRWSAELKAPRLGLSARLLPD